MNAYVYLIGWTKLNVWYCGSRYSSNCHPSDFWKTYFTSSKHVKEFRNVHGDPDHIEILMEFDNRKDAIIYEKQKLKEFDVLKKENWLNKQIGGILFCNMTPRSEETKKKIRKALLGKPRIPHSEEAKRKMSEAAKKRTITTEMREKISKTLSGRKQSQEVIQKRANSNRGKIRTIETKQKMREAKLGKKMQPFSEKTKLKMSLAKIGKKKSEKTKKRMIEAWKLRKLKKELSNV